MKKYLLLSLCLLLGLGTFAQKNSAIEPELQEIINQKGDEMISVNIIFKSQMDNEMLNDKLNGLKERSDRRQSVINELKAFTSKDQKDVMSILQAEERGSKVTNINAHWLVNAINCTTTRDVIYTLSEHPDVYVIGYNKKEKLIDDTKPVKVDKQRGMVDNIMTVGANTVWGEGYTGNDVVVAVLDSGVNYDHVDLTDHLWDGSLWGYPYHGWNFIDNNEYTKDYHGHGTHCAGTICGDGTSGTQTGMAPDATLMCVKVLDDTGHGTFDALVSGVEFAVYNGADVLSISLGWKYPDVSVSIGMRELFENVLASGVVASVAAGNDRDEIAEYPIPRNINAPGNCPPPYLSADQQANPGGLSAVVCVGAVDYYDDPAYFSSEGPVTWQNTYWGDYAYQVEVNDTIFTDGNWMYYDDGTFKNSIGVGADYSFYWGIKFEPEDLQEHGGTALTEIAMYDYAAHTGCFFIYEGGETAPETMINYQSYTATGSGAFVNYNLDYPNPIDVTQPLWIVASNNTGVDYPAAASEFTGNSNGSWCSLDASSWYDIGDPSMLGQSLTWMIRAYVTDEANGEMAELKQIADFNIEQVASADKLSSSGINNNTRNTNTSFGLIRPDVCAPGVSIVSAAYDDNYGFYSMSGTSMATPCVAGVMALMLDKNPDLTPADICRILEETANPLGFNKSNLTGSGRIDAYSAIYEIEGGDDDDDNDDDNDNEITLNDVMSTTYDIQSNGYVANRMYQKEDGSVAVVATMSHEYNTSASDRGTGYNFFDGTNWSSWPDSRVEANATGGDMRTGWPSIAPYGENGEILVNHSTGLNYWIRETAGEGTWDGPYSIPDPTGLDYSYSLSWPRVVTSGPNNDIIHVFASAQYQIGEEYVYAQFYCRSTDGQNWEVGYSPLETSDEHLNIYQADDYCVSSNGDVVAVCYAAPFYGDVVVLKSTDNGLTWERELVWENPYKGDWETDENTITPEEATPTPVHATVAVGSDGVVHVAFSVASYHHAQLGTSFNYYHGRPSDGIVYWNDTREPLTNINLWYQVADGYLYHSMDSVNFCGWMPFYDNIYDFNNDMIYKEDDYIYTFYGSCSGYPALSVDPEGNLAMAYSTIDTRRLYDNSYYYRSVFVSYKRAGQDGWNVAVDELTNDFSLLFSEALSVSAASNSTQENEFWFSFLADHTPGFALGSGASQSYLDVNFVYVSKFVPGDYDDDDNDDKITYCNVLIETFTGRSDLYSPNGHKIANELAAANPGRVFPVNIHAGGFSPTSYPNMNTTDGLTVMNGFNVNAFPSGVVNRTTADAIGRGEWEGVTNAQLNRATEVVISGNVTINPINRVAEITVDLDYVLSSQSSTNYLTVMMLQDSIWGSQSGGNSNPEQYVNGQYCHMHVLRDIITPTWGDEIGNTTSGSHTTMTYIYEIPEIIGDPNGVEVDLNNIYFLAFVTEKYQGTPTRPILNIEKLFINEAEPECDAPSNLTYFVDDVNYDDVVLSWNAPVGADTANVTYEIYPNTTSLTPLYDGITDTTFTIMDLAAGNYRYVVRANWNGECLSNPSNMVEVTIADCAPQDMHEVTIVMNDGYGDGWNEGYIEVVGGTNGLSYQVELSEGNYGETTLSLCPDVYYFNWNKGYYDDEVSFTIYMGDNELYSIEAGSIDDSFSNPFFVFRLEDIYASISDVTYTSAFCSTETNFNINVVNEGLEEITSLKMQAVVDGTSNGDGNWLYYDDGVCTDGIGGPESFYWGIMFPASTLETYVGSYITKVSIFDKSVSTGDIMICYGGTSSPQNLMHVQPYSLNGTNEFVEFDLTSALPINSTTNVWVIFSTLQGTNYPASKSVNTGNPNGRWISLDGSTWGDVLVDYSLDATWMIRAYISDEYRTLVSELMPIADYNYSVGEGVFKASGMAAINTNNTEKSGETIEFTWQGNIPPYQSADIETTLDLALGSHNVKFQIVEINGEAFESNKKSVTVDVEEGIDTYVNGNSGDYTIDIMQGRYGNNITWELLASDNSVIASGGPYQYLNSNTIKLNTETVTIPAGECVKFIVRDNNGNGFSNGGYYRIFDGKGNVVVYNEGNFGYEQSHLLSVISDETMDDSYAENTFNVNVDVPGTLSYKLAAMIEHWSDVYVLKVKGELNATDQQVFSKLTHLMTLDLTETNIASIGGCKELSRLRNVYLPSTLTTVEDQAFYNCKSLYSMDLSETTTIGNRSFSNCISLNSINIPNVTAIDYEAFYYCTSLTSIDIPNVKSLSDNNYEIFGYCTNLSEVILSDELTYIPEYCFNYCTSLQEIELPSSLESIGYSAFYNCALTNINIPEGVTKLYDYAFYGCPVTIVSIPSTIITIGYSIFSNGAITDVYCYAATPVTTSTFGGGLSYATLHVPEFSVVAYKVHDSWYKFGNIVPLEELLSDVYINSEYTIIDYTGLADEVNLTLDLNAHLTVAAGSEFNLDSYKQITSNTEYYEYDNNTWNYTYYYPSTLITYNEMSANNVEVSLVLRTDRWNFISLPFDVNVSDITYPEGTLWVVRKYSGEDRALMTGNTWHNMTDGMTLNAGEGYILHCDHGSNNLITFTFPTVVNESMNNMFSHYDVELPLATYPSEFAHNRSWNLVGNPYPSYFNTNGNIEHNGIITVWDNGYVAYSLLDDYFTLKPYESFFVQCPEDANSMLFKTEGRSHTNDYDDYAKRNEAFKQRNSGDRKIYNFTLANEEYSDRTRLVLNETASTDYEISCDASKFMNDDESVPQVYIYDNEIIYAINERPLGLGVMTMGVRIGQAGEYTLTLDPKEEYNMNVILYDNETGEEIDILNESYTFSAEEGYDHERFVLTITENTIGVEENVILDINDPDVEVYDVMGRRVRVSDDMRTGVYIIKKGNHVQRYFIYE